MEDIILSITSKILIIQNRWNYLDIKDKIELLKLLIFLFLGTNIPYFMKYLVSLNCPSILKYTTLINFV